MPRETIEESARPVGKHCPGREESSEARTGQVCSWKEVAQGKSGEGRAWLHGATQAEAHGACALVQVLSYALG